MLQPPLLELTPEGLYCRVGDFYVDPWRPVPRAVITHAHADHARWGCERYLTAQSGQHVLRARLGEAINLQTLSDGETCSIHGVQLSLHPAGHVLGSCQVRLEYRGRVEVFSGDYKLAPDPTCTPFEPLRCHRFITESTFGLPVYRWQEAERVFEEINAWWRANQDAGRASVIYAYALGKAQRLLAGVDASIGPIAVHGAIETINQAYRLSGICLPAVTPASELGRGEAGGWLVIAPPSAQNTPWLRRFEPYTDAVASGWMAIRGIRRRRAVDHGFVLSDHADWPGLNQAILSTGAEEIDVTHGSGEALARWLRERGRHATLLQSEFHGEADIEPAGVTAS